MKPKNIKLDKVDEFYFATIEGEDEEGNPIYGNVAKIGAARDINIEINPPIQNEPLVYKNLKDGAQFSL